MEEYFLPTSLWGLAAGMSLLLVLLACGIYLWYRSRIKAAVRDSEDVADLAAEKISLESEIAQCQSWLGNNREELLKLDAEREEQERVRQELANFQIQTAEEQQKVDDLRKEANDLQNVVTVLAQDRDKLSKEKETLDKEKREAENARHEMKGLLERYKEEKRKYDELLQNMAKDEIKQQSLIGQVSATEAQLAAAQGELKQVLEKLAKAKADLVPWEEVFAEKERAREDRDRFLKETTELRRITDNLKREEGILRNEVDNLKKEAGARADIIDRYADLMKTEPKCLSKDIFPKGSLDSVQESEALMSLRESLASQGLIFSMRTLKAFHTSLKISEINPLTVLAGVSGTGKTLLPIKYAEAMGMHYLVVSVQPRWDSPQDLFGFYNYLEHKYKATDLARALIRMDSYNFLKIDNKEGLPERMLLVLLDEMNLARVEYYFSEFLSKLELRRGVSNPNNPSDRRLAEIELETGPRSVADSLFHTWVGDNVIFTGTMNEDESTQTLSDKVLDRANVIRFGKPPDTVQAAQGAVNHSQNKFLPCSVWKAWKKPLSAGNNWDNNVNRWIIQINSALERIGRPFGYRVQQAMRLYIANYPGADASYKIAFADQVEQKVLPKLRGIDLNEDKSKESLDEICSLIEDLGDDALRDVFSSSKEDQSAGTFVWRGVTRLPGD